MEGKTNRAQALWACDPTVEVRRAHQGVADVVLIGEHDLVTVPMLEQSLEEAVDSADDVVVDLTQAVFIDSSIIKTLVRASREAAARGVRFSLTAGENPAVRRPLEITNLLDILDNAASLTAARGVVETPEADAGSSSTRATVPAP